MGRLNRSITVAGVALTAPVMAYAQARVQSQAIQPADLVGTWERATRGILEGKMFEMFDGDSAAVADTARSRGDRPATRYDTLFIRADGTFRQSLGDDPHYEHWNYLRGDTLSFHPNGPCLQDAKACLTGTEPRAKGLLCTGASCPKPNESICWKPENPDVTGLADGDCTRGEPGFLIKLEDQQLVVTKLPETSDIWVEGVYRRVAKAPPAP